MTRVIAGSAGGRRLVVPAGTDTRPTTDRVREALFSALGDLSGARVLDLWAGSGALGLEALSRGAREALFVERAPRALLALRANVAALALPGARVHAGEVLALLRRGPDAAELPGGRADFDLVLADPPYAERTEVVSTALATLAECGWLAPGCRVVVERESSAPAPRWPAGTSADPPRRYGGTTLHRAHLLASPTVTTAARQL